MLKFKMNAVDRVDNGETVYAVARSIGVTHKMLLDWRKPGQPRSHKNDQLQHKNNLLRK